jgi:mono/diheme cytochrome c family protein
MRWRVAAAGLGLCGGMALLSACYPGQYPLDIFREMHYQPSQRILQSDRFAAPRDAVPITGTRASVTFEEAAALQSPIARSTQNLEAGRELFKVNCAVCHGADAHGTGPVAERFAAASANPPADLTSQRVRSRSDGQLHWIVTNGLGNMPSFGDLLNDDQRWMLVQVIRGYQGQ